MYEGFVRNNRLLEHFGILYDTFGITFKASTSQPITPEQIIQNLNPVDEYIKSSVMNVKETNNLKEDSSLEDTNLHRASTEWYEERYEQSHKC